MDHELWIFLAFHVSLNAYLLNKLWPYPAPTEKKRVPHRLWWSFFGVVLPGLGPVLALYFTMRPLRHDEME